MNLLWAAAGAIAGLPLGSMLRRPVFQLSVPAGAPDRSACPRCVAPLHGGPAAACGNCGASLGTPVLQELVTAAVLGLLFGAFGGQADVVAFGFLGALGVALAAIDLAVQRIPDRLTLPAYPVMIGLLAMAAAIQHNAAPLLRALLAGGALTACYLLLALAKPEGVGGGDIKLAGLAGLALGWVSWPAVVTGTVLGFMLMAVFSLLLLAARRITWRGEIAFGPFLLGGTLLAVLLYGQ